MPGLSPLGKLRALGLGLPQEFAAFPVVMLDEVAVTWAPKRVTISWPIKTLRDEFCVVVCGRKYLRWNILFSSSCASPKPCSLWPISPPYAHILDSPASPGVPDWETDGSAPSFSQRSSRMNRSSGSVFLRGGRIAGEYRRTEKTLSQPLPHWPLLPDIS